MPAFWDLICSKLRAADKFSQILWHFQTNPFHCWENPDEIMWKAFLIGCRDWENKGKRNTQYKTLEEQEFLWNWIWRQVLLDSRFLRLIITVWLGSTDSRGSSKSPQFQTNRNDRHFSQIINGNADNSDNSMGIIDNTDNRQYRIAWVSFYYKLSHPILKHLCLLDIHAHFQ